MRGHQFLQRFTGDRRALEMDYMLSLFMFIVSLGFTFLVLTQYLGIKHSEVGDVNERLASLRLLDDLTASPGWLGTRTDWEIWASRIDLEEKVNDQGFMLGLRKNDRFYGTGVIIPGASDPLMQTASESSISDAVHALEAKGVIVVRIQASFRAILEINTTAEDPLATIPGSEDNVTTHVGSFYVGSILDVKVTDMRRDGRVRYDTVVVDSTTAQENEAMALSGRNFTVHTIDQERVLLIGQIPEGYVLPSLDSYGYGLVGTELAAADIKSVLYEDILTGGTSSLDYTLFCNADNKFEGQVTELSAKKITALGDDVPYELAKAAMGIQLDFHLKITRKSDGAIILDYGPLTPWDTETAEREVDVEGIPCTFVVDVW